LSNVGAVSFDKDAVYIDIGRANFTKKESLAITDGNDDENESDSESSDEDHDAPASLLRNLQDVKSGVDEKMKKSSLRLFKASKAVQADSDDSSDSDEDHDLENGNSARSSREEIDRLIKPFRKEASFQMDSDSDDDDDDSESERESVDESQSDDDDDSDDSDDNGSNHENDDTNNDIVPGSASASWKRNLAQRAAEAYMGRDSTYINLQEMIYGKSKSNIVSDEDDEEDMDAPKDGNDSDSDDDFFKIKKANGSSSNNQSSSNDISASQLLGEEDSSRAVNGSSADFDLSVWLEEGDDCLLESIRDKFVTGNWGNGDGNGDDDEANGDFEDLETGEKYGPNGEIDSDDDDDEEDTEGMTDAEIRELNAKKKAAKKTNFDDEYDDEKKGAISSTNLGDETAEKEYLDSLKREKEARMKRNKDEFGEDGESSRLRLEGFRQGLYCRIRIDGVPAEFTECFDPNKPVILGGLTPQETNRGYVRCRFKKHRWHKKILKCNDPLIFSVGWRRFQSIPVFSTEDENRRHRYVHRHSIIHS
jgi:ribosome biogenesis protein BMS1